MRKIYVNLRYINQTVTGVQRFSLELCKRMPEFIGEYQIIFIAPKNSISVDWVPCSRIYTFGNFKGQLWEQLDLPIFLRKRGNPLLINLVGLGPILYKNKVIALYDLSFKHHPEWFSYTFQKIYNTFVPVSIRNSRSIITDSYYVKNDISISYKINLTKIKVLYAAPSGVFVHKNLKRDKIILTVSSIEPRKNLKGIIDAYKLLSADYKLIIVGKRNKSFAEDKLDEETNDKIIFTGYLSDEELVNLYNKAEIFIYASLFEGFGIPPLEAQACGCCCIVSNTTALPEVYSDSVEYCNPYSIESIKSGMNNLIIDKNKRAILKEKGFENVKRYSWDKSSKELVNIIENILYEKSPST